MRCQTFLSLWFVQTACIRHAVSRHGQPNHTSTCPSLFCFFSSVCICLPVCSPGCQSLLFFSEIKRVSHPSICPSDWPSSACLFCFLACSCSSFCQINSSALFKWAKEWHFELLMWAGVIAQGFYILAWCLRSVTVLSEHVIPPPNPKINVAHLFTIFSVSCFCLFHDRPAAPPLQRGILYNR